MDTLTDTPGIDRRSTTDRSRPPTVRIVLAIVAVLFLAGAILFVPSAAYALLSPYSGVPVPAACAAGTSGPTIRTIQVPGYGAGVVLAADDAASIAAVPAADGGTAGGTIHLVAGDRVLFTAPVAGRAAAGGLQDGRAYLFDDKIGYFIDATTGEPIPRVFTIDNYRGLYMAAGVEHVQTDFEVAFIGAPGVPISALKMPFGAVVDACLLAVG